MNIEKLKPLNDRILLEVLEDEEEYKGSITIAPMSKEKSYYGIVKAVYNSYNGKEPIVKVGDIVAYQSHSGVMYKTGNALTPDKDRKEIRLIKESDLLGIFDEG